MTAIVPELVNLASDRNVSVEDLLRKALVVARRLAIPDLVEWIDCELNNYNGKEIPEYRMVKGQLQVLNPMRGYIPFMPSPPSVADVLSHLHIRQSTAELGDLAESQTGVHMSFPPSVEADLMRGMELMMRPSVKLTTGQIRGILDTVRNRVLSWALDLEDKGIFGEGMTFSTKEKQMVREQHYHFGDVTGSQIQIGTAESKQTQNNTSDLIALKQLIDAIGSSIDRDGITGEIRDELRAELATLKAQAESPKPKWQIIKATALSIKSVLENAAGSVIATQALPYLAPFIS